MNQVPVVLALLVFLCGCQTTMHPLSHTDESAVRLSIAVGDTVRVLTKHGERPTFKVTDITDDVLIGEDQSIRFDDMAFIEKRHRGVTKGSALAVALVLVGGAVLVDTVSEIPPGIPSVQ